MGQLASHRTIPERAGLSATHTRDIFYGYDLRGMRLFARFDSPTGEGITNVYDALGRMTATTTLMDGVSRQISRTYDVSGNLTRLTHPDGVFFDMVYDSLNRMTHSTWNGTVPFLGIGYDDLGRRYGITRASSHTTYGYDAASRLSSINQLFASGNLGMAETLGYNPASQIVTRTRDNDAYAWTGHVNVDRPYSANGLNQYVSAGPASFTYDMNGNLTGDGASNYVYDVENRLVAATGARTANLRYDPPAPDRRGRRAVP